MSRFEAAITRTSACWVLADPSLSNCPVCSTRLNQRKCKLFCEKCGYYMSCADYY